MTHFISVYDAPLTPSDGEIVDGQVIVIQEPTYGRVLFATNYGIFVDAQNVTISNCCLYWNARP